MTNVQLKKMLDDYFCPPFLPEGMVTTGFRLSTIYGPILSIKIGRRDVGIDEDGNVVGHGTSLIEPPPEDD